jgi:tRNA-Thr(GGU) m(6)t(6)A37 methyltransferase TsaA
MEAAMTGKICFRPIGTIHSPFHTVRGVPIQAAAAMGVRGSLEIYEACAEGLKDLEGFSHLILLYHFHLTGETRLRLKPFLDDTERGVFATRAPTRPNPIGLSVVRLLAREGNILTIEGVDMVDGTPLLDIKPYVPRFDVHPGERIGWLTERLEALKDTRADDRFA